MNSKLSGGLHCHSFSDFRCALDGILWKERPVSCNCIRNRFVLIIRIVECHPLQIYTSDTHAEP